MRMLISSVAAVGLLLMFQGITSPPSLPRRSRISASLAELAAEAGWPRGGARALVLLCTTLGAAAVLAALMLGGILPLALVAGVCAGRAPVVHARRKRRQRRAALARSWPDALAGIIAGIRAGMSLPECCRAQSSTGPMELRPAFNSFSTTYSATGSFEAGLGRLRDELQEPVADRVVSVLLITHEVGGNDVVRVLRATGDMVREDGRIRDEVQARCSWTKAAARLAAAAPFLVLGVMSLRPEGATAYASAAGLPTVAGGTFATWLGYRLMLRAARLPEDHRLIG